MPELQNAELLAAWLEGTLDDEQRRRFEALCIEDQAFAAQVEAANQFSLSADNYVPSEVPQWDRNATFAGPEKARWWQWGGLPALSFTTSAMAIVMVLTGTQIKVDSGSITLTFNQRVSERQVEQLVQQRLDSFALRQQESLNTYAQALQQQQTDTNTQLTEYLLSSSRQERREDFAELIKFINQQRSDDQVFYARQLNKLQREIYNDPQAVAWPQSGNDPTQE